MSNYDKKMKQIDELKHHFVQLDALIVWNRKKHSTFIANFVKNSLKNTDINDFISYFKHIHFGFNQTWFKDLNHFLSCPIEDQPYLFGAASLNYDGYVREEALKRIGELNAPVSFPFVLLRLSDNVPKIRELASDILMKKLPQLPISIFLDNIKLIEWLRYVEKINLSKYQDEINKNIASKEADYLTFAPTLTIKQKLFYLKAIKLHSVFSQAVLDTIIKDKSEKIRYFEIETLKFEQDKERILQAINDKSVVVKFLAMTKIPKNRFLDYREVFIESLTNKAKSIRDFSRFVLKHENFDFIGYYRDCYEKTLQSSKNGLKIALCEKSEECDLSLVQSFLNSAVADLRAASLLAVNSLMKENALEHNLKAMSDVSSKVRKIAINYLISNLDCVKTLEDCLLCGNDREKRYALHILTNKSGSIGLNAILVALRFEGEMGKLAEKHVHAWYNRFGVTGFSLTTERYQTIMQAYSQLKIDINSLSYPQKKLWQELIFLFNHLKPR